MNKITAQSDCHSGLVGAGVESAVSLRVMIKSRINTRLAVVAIALATMLITPLPLPAQPSPSQDPPKPKPNTDTATQNAPDQPMWDPLRAEKDLEVGQYYMKKGDMDAAIDRFQDAALAKPGYAIPFRLLGEAQEKKGLKRDALKSYTRYLDLYPHAEDKEKIEKKIEKLRAEVAKSKKKSAG
jgi:tetratricopeptide (TPR) repeat protein